MRVRWRGLELPLRLVCDKESFTPTYGKFYAEPFERGFGTTVGNSLRRVLLSSIEGAAVTSLRVQGVQHEFSSIKGVKEDVTDIVLNLKKLLVRMHTDDVKVLKIDAHKKGEIRGSDVITDPSVEIANPDHVIATLTDDVDFVAELTVRKGRGYVTAEENAGGHHEIGVVSIDSIFSPVVRVNVKSENTRVGQMTNYDRLTLEVWTTGVIAPDMAVVEAAKILRKHLNPFVNFFDAGAAIPVDATTEDDEKRRQFLDSVKTTLDKEVADLALSVRASNCLKSQNIDTLRQLVAMKEDDLMKIRNFGRTSLDELVEKLKPLGLSLGMNVN